MIVPKFQIAVLISAGIVAALISVFGSGQLEHVREFARQHCYYNGTIDAGGCYDLKQFRLEP